MTDHAIRTVTADDGRTLAFYPDANLDRPYQGDEGVKIVVLHRRYINPASGDIDTRDEADAFEAANRPRRTPGGTQWVIFPLFLHDHGNTIYEVSEGPNPFVGRSPYAAWDSGRVGFIALKRSEWGSKSRRKLFAWAREIAANYTAWANGDGVGWVLTDAQGVHLDSLWGFYSLDEAAADAKATTGLS